MIYWELFLSFLQVGLFSFGGGYAAMPLIRGQVVSCPPYIFLFLHLSVTAAAPEHFAFCGSQLSHIY